MWGKVIILISAGACLADIPLMTCTQRSTKDDIVHAASVQIDSIGQFQQDSVWKMGPGRLLCLPENGLTLLRTWVRIDSMPYDYGFWVSLSGTGGEFDYCQSIRNGNRNQLNPSDTTAHWPLYFESAYPWSGEVGYVNCKNSDFGFPANYPEGVDWTKAPTLEGLLPVKGRLVFEILQGQDTVYRYVPFRLDEWKHPLGYVSVQESGAGWGQGAPIRQGAGWLFPKRFASDAFTAYGLNGRSLSIQREVTAGGILVQVPQGRGIVLIRAGREAWKLVK